MWSKIAVKTGTKKKLIDDCVKEFLKIHPEFNDYNITADFILNKVIDYYLNH